MKNEQACGKKLLAPVAAAVALGMGASAQFAGNQDSSAIVEGQAILEVSLEGDIRDAQQAGRRKIVLHRDGTRELEIRFLMRPRPELDALAVMPTLEEMEKTVMLVNGTPGSMAVIHLETRAPEVRNAGGRVRVAGMFDADGQFAVNLPDDLDTRGLFSWGQEILELSDMVKKPVAGSARPTQRPEVDAMDLGETTEEAFFNWVFYWTDLQLKNSGRFMASASLEESASLLAVASAPVGTQRVADKIVLHRPRTPSLGGGHVLPGTEVDDTEIGTDPVISDPVVPQRGHGALNKIRLQRPRTPSLGHGHALPATEIEDDTGSGVIIVDDPADPQGGQRAGDKIRLQRPVERRDHVLQHRR